MTSCFQIWSNSGIAPSEPPLSLSNDSSSSLSWSSLVIPSALCLIRPRNTRFHISPASPMVWSQGCRIIYWKYRVKFINKLSKNLLQRERETGSMSAAVKTLYLAHDHPMRIDSSWQLLWFIPLLSMNEGWYADVCCMVWPCPDMGNFCNLCSSTMARQGHQGPGEHGSGFAWKEQDGTGMIIVSSVGSLHWIGSNGHDISWW